LYRKKSSFWTIAGACFIRRRKYQIEMMEAMSAIAPPTVPPTMAPKLVEGAVVLVGDGVEVLVLVGVLVDRDEPAVGEGVGVTESADTVGVLEADAPTPISTGVGFI
jgi:hypothetical protein